MADRFVRPPRQLVEATPTCDFRRIPEIRRPWPLQFMAANGRRENRRQPVSVGSMCVQAQPAVFRVGSGEAPFLKRQPSQRNPPRCLARQAVCFIDVLNVADVSAVGVI